MNLQHKKLTEQMLAKIGFDHNCYYYEKTITLKGTKESRKIGYCGICADLLIKYSKGDTIDER